ncbi:MAG: glyoxalase [Rhodobacterales bacterium]|nr:MAG: glyoxalase [Rhodobacterales bacterium]
MPTFLIALHHIQLAIPAGSEDDARTFYVGVLRMCEIDKPTALQGRGGCWFESGTIQLHLGVETPFTPARKAHPAFVTGDLDQLCAQLDAHGVDYRRDADLPDARRVFVSDPFGNRIELIEPLKP